MALTDFLFPWALLALPLVAFVIPFLRRTALRDIPGPFPAQFTNLWLLWHSRFARRSFAVDAAHKKYGKMVRVQPDHVSIADDNAINAVYGHGNGFIKADFYDAFVAAKHRGLFNVRDRSEHTRKRKIVSHVFSARSVGEFEQYIHHNLDDFIKQWDKLAAQQNGNYVDMDALHWFNYLAFDVIGDLAFGAPFGMVEKGADVAEVRESPESPPTFAPAVEVLNRRGEVSATMGCMPWIKPFAKHLPDPFFSKGVRAVENLTGIARARIRMRIEGDKGSERKDLLARLQQAKDDNGNPMPREELTAEALTQLIAGSDTTSNTSCALLYYVLRTPGVVQKLQAELDDTIPDQGLLPPNYSQVKDLPYMDNVINETLRVHSTSSMGLPRIVPPGPGVTILDKHFPQGTVLSVPAYTIHHSKEIWGPDADEFNPDRWNKENLTERQKNAFIPFSYGPRACVGRNVAMMELALTIATVFRRYEFQLKQSKLETREGFLKKPVACKVGMRRRSD